MVPVPSARITPFLPNVIQWKPLVCRVHVKIINLVHYCIHTHTHRNRNPADDRSGIWQSHVRFGRPRTQTVADELGRAD